MKKVQISSLIVVFVAILFACTKEKTKLSISATSGANLAGSAGSSKIWKITEGFFSTNGGAQTPLQIDACQLDNTFTFNNNSTQTYITSEGLTKCNSTDSTVVESGSWAFTDDGKTLLVDGQWFDDLSQVSSGWLFVFSAWGGPVNVIELTSTTMKISVPPFNSGGKIYTLFFTFTKV